MVRHYSRDTTKVIVSEITEHTYAWYNSMMIFSPLRRSIRGGSICALLLQCHRAQAILALSLQGGLGLRQETARIEQGNEA